MKLLLERYLADRGSALCVHGRDYTLSRVRAAEKAGGGVAVLRAARKDYFAVRCIGMRVPDQPDSELWAASVAGGKTRIFAVCPDLSIVDVSASSAA